MKKKKVLAVVIAALVALPSNFVYAEGAKKIQKDEMVFNVYNNGKMGEESTVSVHLRGDLTEVDDNSILKDIKNLKSSEIPIMNGNELKWRSNEANIFYQGKTDKQLPFDIYVKYYIDGKEIDEKDLTGKTGHLRIELEIKNNIKKQVKIDGVDKTIYKPLVVNSIFSFDDKKVSNIVADKAKTFDDSNNTRLVFVNIPGLRESIKDEVGEKTLDKIQEDSVVVEADVVDYENKSIIVIASSDVSKLMSFDEEQNLSSLDKLQKLKDAGKDIENASTKLKKGSEDFSSGLVKYTNGVDEIAKGGNRLKVGADEILKSTSTLSDGNKLLSDNVQKIEEASVQFKNGTKEYSENIEKYINKNIEYQKGITPLVSGISEISKNMELLTAGFEKLNAGYMELSKGVQKAIPSLYDNIKKLDDSYAGIDKGIQALVGSLTKVGETKQGLEGGIKKVHAGNSSSISELETLYAKTQDEETRQALALVIKNLKINEEILKQAEQGLTSASLDMDKVNMLKDSSSKFAKGLSELYGSKDKVLGNMQEGIETLSTEGKKLSDGSKQFSEGSNKLATSSKAIIEGNTALIKAGETLQNKSIQIAEGSEKLTKGTSELIGGVGKITEGVNKLVDEGMQPLASGAVTLSDSLSLLNQKSSELVKGYETLKEGTNSFCDGAVKYKQEGVDKLLNELTKLEDLNSILKIKDEIDKLESETKSFSGTTDDFDTSTLYFIKIQ